MRKFEQYFKLPFVYDRYGSYVFDSNKELVFQFYYDIPEEKQKELFDMINGTIPAKHMVIYKMVSGGIYIMGVPNAIVIRGWGYLTSLGGLNLTDEEAEEIQSDIANYIVEKLTVKA